MVATATVLRQAEQRLVRERPHRWLLFMYGFRMLSLTSNCRKICQPTPASACSPCCGQDSRRPETWLAAGAYQVDALVRDVILQAAARPARQCAQNQACAAHEQAPKASRRAAPGLVILLCAEALQLP